jgi:hypothetical protein
MSSDDSRWFHGNERWSVHGTWMWVSAQTARKPSEASCDPSRVGKFTDVNNIIAQRNLHQLLQLALVLWCKFNSLVFSDQHILITFQLVV